MALPEDDLEEVDPEPAIARILDHEHDAIVLGPGLRPGLATVELVRELLDVPDDPPPAPIVLDAEALRSMATLGEWWSRTGRRCVLTPHPGEFARLRTGAGIEPDADGDLADDDAARAAAAKDAAVTWGQIVVLKGARTVIAEPDGTVTAVPFENPALATGGTGDVLAGTIGSLLAQGLAPGPAARLGVYLHGLAGDTVRERLGDAGLLASDLPDAIPIVRKRLVGLAERAASERRFGFAPRDDVAATPPSAPANAPGGRPAEAPATPRAGDGGRD